tara:strand:+ start:9950 stop:10216 length:267 start_codon:yes stop_codon:yes gene_type:complete
MEQIGKIKRIVNEAAIYDGMTSEDASRVEELLDSIVKKLNSIKVWYPDAYNLYGSPEIHWEGNSEEITSMGKEAIGVVFIDELSELLK